MGDDYFSLNQLGRASRYYTKAFELRQHANDRSKLLITGDYYSTVTGEHNTVAPAETAIDFQQEMRMARANWQINIYSDAKHSFTGEVLPATEHTKLDSIHKRKPDRGKQRSSSYEKYWNKGYSDDVVTRIGRQGTVRPYPRDDRRISTEKRVYGNPSQQAG